MSATETGQRRWKQRPEGSTWGDFGDDDQLGRLNLLTPAKVLEGLAEVRSGQTFCLSLPLDYPGGSALNERRLPPVLRPSAGRLRASPSSSTTRSHRGCSFSASAAARCARSRVAGWACAAC